MKLYADRPTRVLGQLAGDLVVAILVFLAVRLGRGTHEKVAALAAPGRDAEDAARSTAGSMRDAAGNVDGTPLVGDAVAKPFQALAATSRQLAESAQAYQDSVERLAVLSGILVAACRSCCCWGSGCRAGSPGWSRRRPRSGWCAGRPAPRTCWRSGRWPGSRCASWPGWTRRWSRAGRRAPPPPRPCWPGWSSTELGLREPRNGFLAA